MTERSFLVCGGSLDGMRLSSEAITANGIVQPFFYRSSTGEVWLRHDGGRYVHTPGVSFERTDAAGKGVLWFENRAVWSWR